VLLIHGTEDNLNDIAHSRRLAESRPDWEFVALEGCGHAPHLRDPVKVNLLMMDFLRRSHK
jgi:pimeloyl-ACP methyl ester carboxylesterase